MSYPLTKCDVPTCSTTVEPELARCRKHRAKLGQSPNTANPCRACGNPTTPGYRLCRPCYQRKRQADRKETANA